MTAEFIARLLFPISPRFSPVPPGGVLVLPDLAPLANFHFPAKSFVSCKARSRVSIMAASPADPSMETEAPLAAVTRERKLNTDLQEQLPKPYLARALVAVDPSHPKGTEGRDPRGMSVLQQHAAFFDRNGDGVIYPWETFKGLRAIGCSFPKSLFFAFFINLALSYPTQSYGRTVQNALTKDELNFMLKSNRNMYDFIGWIAASAEWKLLYDVAKDKDGLLQRETVRGVFDGSLFDRLQNDKKSS
ncbi:hypothetical protein PR202_ga26551 [Eleusine coracana subsp. coracana]|uniref:Caleosin n=1 Tax=Eleusine coracana subsp. coracana TaxID=191504 RepID=A0AAV5DDM3_ELECO|nr:hypothetical protein PR202_ga26551 [Eleusine coracana subsp. coracana]